MLWRFCSHKGQPYIKVYIHGPCHENGYNGALAGSTVYFGFGTHISAYANQTAAEVPGLHQTNNRAVLHGVILALDTVVQHGNPKDKRQRRVAVYCSSNYPSYWWNTALPFHRNQVTCKFFQHC